jgi:hypothetical protein
MPLPSSGQISIKDIFDEATGGGCYEGGSGYSLGALADAFEISTNPDAMSEFYGLSCPVNTATIEIYNNSLDVPITSVAVNETSVTYVSGQNFTINAGQNGTFSTDQLGTYDVEVSYNSHTPGQNITIVDSDNNTQCFDLDGESGSHVFTGVVVTGGTTVTITISDGACL